MQSNEHHSSGILQEKIFYKKKLLWAKTQICCFRASSLSDRWKEGLFFHTTTKIPKLFTPPPCTPATGAPWGGWGQQPTPSSNLGARAGPTDPQPHTLAPGPACLGPTEPSSPPSPPPPPCRHRPPRAAPASLRPPLPGVQPAAQHHHGGGGPAGRRAGGGRARRALGLLGHQPPPARAPPRRPWRGLEASRTSGVLLGSLGVSQGSGSPSAERPPPCPGGREARARRSRWPSGRCRARPLHGQSTKGRGCLLKIKANEINSFVCRLLSLSLLLSLSSSPSLSPSLSFLSFPFSPSSHHFSPSFLSSFSPFSHFFEHLRLAITSSSMETAHPLAASQGVLPMTGRPGEKWCGSPRRV